MTEDRTARVVVGIAFVLGSLVLLYFSALPVLRCARSSEGVVECRAQAWLLNALKVSDKVVRNVGVVTLLPPNARGGDPFLRFSSPSGLVDLGYFSERFVRDAEVIKAFLADRSRSTLTLEKTLGGRALFAHVIAGFMLLLGVSALWSLARKPEAEPEWEASERELKRLQNRESKGELGIKGKP